MPHTSELGMLGIGPCKSPPGDCNVLPGLGTPTGQRGHLQTDLLWTSAHQGEQSTSVWLARKPPASGSITWSWLEMHILGPQSHLRNQGQRRWF